MGDIRLDGISKIYGKPSHSAQALTMLQAGADISALMQQTGCQVGLYDINMHIKAGELFCIMGLSGSGKSTLVRHINRLIDPSAGTVTVDGVNVTALSLDDLRTFRRRHISMVFQHFGLLPHLTVLQNTAYALRVRGLDKATRQEQAAHWLAEVGLAGHEHHYPDQLSGGMRQRVGLARALAADTDIVLMDEAFSALDPLIRQKLQQQVLALQSKLNKTIVFITHDIDEALLMGNRIAMLNAGRLVQTGTPAQLQHEPANDYVAQFMRAKRKPI